MPISGEAIEYPKSSGEIDQCRRQSWQKVGSIWSDEDASCRRPGSQLEWPSSDGGNPILR